MRRKIIAGNWKMNLGTPQAAKELAWGLVEKLGTYKDADVVLCPPFTALPAVVDEVAESRIAVGAQNLYPEVSGAYTGEISPQFIRDIGCKYVIVGHSERRQYFGETDEFINRKVKLALELGLIPIMCCGETEAEREEGRTEEIVLRHVTGGLSGIHGDLAVKVVLAYEPVWAIGTGRTATPDQAQEVHAFIRDLLAKMFDAETAARFRIQYGGSVKPDNARDLLTRPDIDGALVGGASLKVDSFAGIVMY
ncbi:triose-phosphate isomerase [bacterium]|nr:triose-phosphate isomerase [bacterium]